MLPVPFELLLSLLVAKFTDVICISEEEKPPDHISAIGKSQAVVYFHKPSAFEHVHEY